MAAITTLQRVRRPVVAAILGGWAFAVAGELWGAGHALHHDTLIEGGLPRWAALALFLVAWQAMIAAMMLPSSLPLIALFARAAANQSHPRRAAAAFVGGYAAVWSLFGAVAFIGDMGVHQAVDAWPWLHERPWLIGGSTLLLAGAFQFSSLKDRCLHECRRPEAFLVGRYARGLPAAFRIGREHGLFCLGCCWALMLLMFAAGVANLAWMGALTLVMVIEKTARVGERAVGVIGVVLLLLGALALAHPPGFPSLFAAR
jgi:predicted metal-binding membrane protein